MRRDLLGEESRKLRRGQSAEVSSIWQGRLKTGENIGGGGYPREGETKLGSRSILGVKIVPSLSLEGLRRGESL